MTRTTNCFDNDYWMGKLVPILYQNCGCNMLQMVFILELALVDYNRKLDWNSFGQGLEPGYGGKEGFEYCTMYLV